MPKALALPEELTIYAVGELREPWLRWATALRGKGDAPVAAQAVDQVDAAGMQLLLSLARTLAERQRRLLLRDASSPLREACHRLGVQYLLGEAAPAATA